MSSQSCERWKKHFLTLENNLQLHDPILTQVPSSLRVSADRCLAADVLALSDSNSTTIPSAACGRCVYQIMATVHGADVTEADYYDEALHSCSLRRAAAGAAPSTPSSPAESPQDDVLGLGHVALGALVLAVSLALMLLMISRAVRRRKAAAEMHRLHFEMHGAIAPPLPPIPAVTTFDCAAPIVSAENDTGGAGGALSPLSSNDESTPPQKMAATERGRPRPGWHTLRDSTPPVPLRDGP